jgi:hypothetical protein
MGETSAETLSGKVGKVSQSSSPSRSITYLYVENMKLLTKNTGKSNQEYRKIEVLLFHVKKPYHP